MRSSNKKILKKIAIVILVDILFFSVISNVFLDNGKNVINAEKNYKKEQTEDNLFNLCNQLVKTERYKKIIQYYPTLFASPNFDKLLSESDFWKADRESMAIEDIKNIFIITYLDAIYEVYGETKVCDEFQNYSTIMEIVVRNNKVETFDLLQLYFFNSLGKYYSGYNEEKISLYMQLLSELWQRSEHTEHENNCYHLFCCRWYAIVNDTENYKYAHDKITKLYDANFLWQEELPNNYTIGYAENYKCILLGIIGYGSDVLIEIDKNIISIANNEKYIIVECSEGFYIVDSEKNIVTNLLNQVDYEKKVKELGLFDLNFRAINKDGIH